MTDIPIIDARTPMDTDNYAAYELRMKGVDYLRAIIAEHDAEGRT